MSEVLSQRLDGRCSGRSRYPYRTHIGTHAFFSRLNSAAGSRIAIAFIPAALLGIAFDHAMHSSSSQAIQREMLLELRHHRSRVSSQAEAHASPRHYRPCCPV